MALLIANYGLTFAGIGALTRAQFRYLLDSLPVIEMRRHLPIAQLEAAIRNALGGKPDSDSKNMSPDKVYSATELLPPYAVPDYISQSISKETAIDIIKNIKEMPMWAINALDIRQIERISRG